MDRAELDKLMGELIEERLPKREADRLLEQVTSDPLVARAYAEAQLRAELLADQVEQRRSARAARRRSWKKAAFVRWFRRLTGWRSGIDRS